MSGAVLRDRLRLLEELRQIVTAMRNLAYAELQRLNHSLAAQEKAEQVVLHALADTQPSGCVAHREAGAPTFCLMIGAERGFCGGFNDELADALPNLRARHPGARWFVAGTRLRQRAEGVLLNATWLAGCDGIAEATSCVESWLSTLIAGQLSSAEAALSFWVAHHAERGVTTRRLLPMPDLPAPTPGPEPMRQLPRRDLMPKLLAETMRVALLGSLYQSLLQENRWRLAQMERAQDFLRDSEVRLRHRYFRERQSEITSELETLMSSVDRKAEHAF